MSKDLNRQKQLFEAALEQDPSVRADWLRRACGDDEELFVTVWELLESHAAAGSFLATPEAMVQRQLGLPATPAPAPNTEQPGQWVGGYKLLEPLGEGGFGIVWMAQQEQPVRRLVALKVLKAGMDSAQVVARFEQERQALAVMQHPHIAQVFDAGVTSAGRPFFVMELVKGVPINDYCARERLSVPARLQLFVQVCRAVQHAHGKGVIHRDIKPRNVLVATHDGKPLAKVIDFGIAKATGARLTERTLFTEHRAMVGTLEYMSPEQAEGLLDIDTRADVYSLGALLYELLTGGTPFDSRKLLDAGMAELLRALREDEPQRPSLRVSSKAAAGWAGGAGRAIAAVDEKALFGALRGDLDWVVMKALEKDRGRRYASADGLAEDVERYLAGDAVLAVPPSVGYRVRKLVRRHRAAIWAAAVMVVAVGVAGSVAIVSWSRQKVSQQRELVAHEGERHANYVAALRACIESANVGNRQRALEVLNACDSGRQDWEWRHASAVAQDAVRLIAERCVAWGTETTDRWSAFIEQALTAGAGGYLVHDQLVLLDTNTGLRTILWEGPSLHVKREREVAASRFANHEIIVVNEDRIVALPRGPALWEVRSGDIHIFSRSAGAWRCKQYNGGGMLCPGDDGAFIIRCDSSGQIQCLNLDLNTMWTQSLSFHAVDIDYDRGRGVAVLASPNLLNSPQGTLPEVLALKVADGSVVWRSTVKVDWHASHMGTAWPNRVRAVPELGLCVLWDAVELSNDMNARFRIVLADLDDGAVTYCERGALDDLFSACFLSTESLDARGVSLIDVYDFNRKHLPSRWSFGSGDEMIAVWDRHGQVHKVIMDILDEAIDVLGFEDMWPIPSTWEWTTAPRRYRSAHRVGFGTKPLGLACVRQKLLLFADRPHDIFPPHPLGLQMSVTTLGMWRNQPSAIYPGGITTLDCDAAVRLPIENGPFPIDAAAATTSGSHTAIISSTTLRVLDTTTGADHGHSVELPGKARAIALTPNAQHAATLVDAADGSLLLATYSVADGAPTARVSLPAPNPADTLFVLAASANQLAVAAGSGPLRLFTLPDLRELPVPAGAAMPARAMQFAPAGDVLAIGRLDGRIDLLRRDGSLNAIPNVHLGGVAALTWSVGGSRLFTAGEDGFVRLWDPMRRVELLNLGDNSVPGQPGIRAFEGKPCCLFATPDGERLFCGYTDGAVRVWDTVPWLERVARRKAREASAPQQPK